MLWTSEQPGLWPHRAQAKKTQEKKAFWGLCQILGVPGGAPWGLRLCVCVHSGGKEPFWIPFSALASLCPRTRWHTHLPRCHLHPHEVPDLKGRRLPASPPGSPPRAALSPLPSAVTSLLAHGARPAQTGPAPARRPERDGYCLVNWSCPGRASSCAGPAGRPGSRRPGKGC